MKSLLKWFLSDRVGQIYLAGEMYTEETRSTLVVADLLEGQSDYPGLKCVIPLGVD